MTQAIQQAAAAKQDVVPGFFKIARVPGIGHIPVLAGIFHEVVNFSGAVLPYATLQVSLVFAVHDYKQVKIIIVVGSDKAGAVVSERDSVFCENLPGPPVHSVTDFVIVGGGRINVKIVLKPGLTHEMLHDHLGHG